MNFSRSSTSVTVISPILATTKTVRMNWAHQVQFLQEHRPLHHDPKPPSARSLHSSLNPLQ